MPTGYTAELVEKGQNFRDFALQCARAFGVCIEQRDDPMTDKPKLSKVSSYHSKELTKAKKALAKAKAMTKEQRLRYGKKQKAEDIKDRSESLKTINDQNQRIKNMMAEVESWAPPTKEHEGLKVFMMEQLEISLTDVSYYESALTTALNQTPEEYYSDHVKSLRWNVNYHTEQSHKETESTQNRNEWINELYQSLKKNRKQS